MDVRANSLYRALLEMLMNPLPPISPASHWYTADPAWVVTGRSNGFPWPFAQVGEYLWQPLEGTTDERVDELHHQFDIARGRNQPVEVYVHSDALGESFRCLVSPTPDGTVVRVESCPTGALLEWATAAARLAVQDRLVERARREAPAALAVLLAAA